MSNEKNKKNQKPELKSIVANRINRDCRVAGDIQSETDIRIDGTVEGNISCEAKVVVGDNGYVKGDIRCMDLTSEGNIQGNIHVLEVLFLKKTSKTGPFSVKFSKIIIEEGAEVHCRLMPQNNPEIRLDDEE